MTPEEFDLYRRHTIEMVNPELVREIRNCAEALEMSFEEFLAVLQESQDDDRFYQNMGTNQAYDEFDWNKIWAGWELITGKQAKPSSWGGPRRPFSCAC